MSATIETIFHISVIFYIWTNLVHSYRALKPLRKQDDTDPPMQNSGLCLYTDHETGIQYVGTLFGGLTLRVIPKCHPRELPTDNQSVYTGL